MKKLINLVFAVAMMFSVVFIGDAINSNAPFSVSAQQKVTVKRRKKGIIRKSYAGGKWGRPQIVERHEIRFAKSLAGHEMDRQKNLEDRPQGRQPHEKDRLLKVI